MKRLLIVTAFLSIAAVSNAQEQRPVVTAVRHNVVKELPSFDWVSVYEQPAIYKQWWKEVGDCLKIPSMEREQFVTFFFVNSPDFTPTPSDKPGAVIGATYAVKEQIYIAIRQIKNERDVKHEMAHQHLYWSGDPTWDKEDNKAFRECNLGR